MQDANKKCVSLRYAFLFKALLFISFLKIFFRNFVLLIEQGNSILDRHTEYHCHNDFDCVAYDKGVTPAARALAKVSFAATLNQAVPIAYKTIVANIIPSSCIGLLLRNLSAKKPIINDIGIYPMRYPPVGPTSLASPAPKLEKTGTPTIPKSRYIIVHKTPFFQPNR